MWNGKNYVDYIGYTLKFVCTWENKCINVGGEKRHRYKKNHKKRKKIGLA